MHRILKNLYGGPAVSVVAAALLALAGPGRAQEPASVSAVQTAPLYSEGALLEVTGTFTIPEGRTVESLVWTPDLPAGWDLVGATGDGDPMVDTEGVSIPFWALNLSASPTLVFRYTVRVPPGTTGRTELGGTADYQLNGESNPTSLAVPAITLSDTDAQHALAGYLAGQTQTVSCSFAYPVGRQLQSLLWKPQLPSGWELRGAAGQGAPEIDLTDLAVVFTAEFGTNNPVVFSYTVFVPANNMGNKELGGAIDFYFDEMPNEVTTRALPDPLVVRPMHTLEVISPYGLGQPAAGLYTNYYGTVLTNQMSQTAAAGTRTLACAGWLLSGNEPVVGTGYESVLTLTNNASLTWVWAAPQVGDRFVDEMTNLGFAAPVSYTADFEPLALNFSLDAASLAANMSITPDGIFSWTPTEEQGGRTNSVTVTVTDNGQVPHWFVASETFEIAVAEVNRAPILGVLSDQLADAQSTLTFTATASDPDLPGQSLTFSLDADSYTAGMRINPTNGVFTWSPTVEQAGIAGLSYTVYVTVTDDGSNADDLHDTQSFTIGVVDSRATHATVGYLQGRTAEITCTFAYPSTRPLEFLLWKPQLPPQWKLLSASGDGYPEVDTNDSTVVFTGAFPQSGSQVVFSYLVEVPAGVTGPQSMRAVAEYQVQGMLNPVAIAVNPDPLVIPELHTFEVISAEGQCTPAVGLYTNLHGAPVSAAVSTPLVRDTRTFVCTGWTLAGIDPADGAGSAVASALTNDAVLTWNWVSPLISPSNSVTVAMSEDGSPAAWSQPALSASEPYRPSLEAGLVWTLLSGPSNGTASVSGTGVTPTISYKPATNWFGGDSFVVQAADVFGGLDHVAVHVNVNPVNDAPVLASIGDQRTDERTPLTFTATASDEEVPPQALAYTMSGAPSGATLDSETGLFTWTPAPGQAGTDFAEFTVTVTVTDNGTSPAGLSDSETFKITLDSSRATHSTLGYRAGQPLKIDCTFAYPVGRQLQSLVWHPELPDGWELLSASGDGDPQVDAIDGTLVFGDFALPQTVSFSYLVSVPPGVTGQQQIGGTVDYLLNDMDNALTVRAQPDLLVIPMLVTLPALEVADKIYDGLTNATVLSYGALAGVMPGHDVALVTSNSAAYFDTPAAGTNKTVTVGGLALSGTNASWYAIDSQTNLADIILVSGTQACNGFRSPSSGTTSISNNFVYPAGRALTSLVWRPVLPAGWTLFGASGDGEPSLSGDGTSIVFAGPFTRNPAVFSYTVTVPGNQAVTNLLNAGAEFSLFGMTGTLVAENLPPALLLKRYHSADYRTSFSKNVPDWKIDTAEASRALLYYRSGGSYHGTNVTSSTPDGYDVGQGAATGGYYSADYRTSFSNRTPDWKIDTAEASRVLLYYRSGGAYHGTNVTISTPDGYDVGP